MEERRSSRVRAARLAVLCAAISVGLFGLWKVCFAHASDGHDAHAAAMPPAHETSHEAADQAGETHDAAPLLASAALPAGPGASALAAPAAPKPARTNAVDAGLEARVKKHIGVGEKRALELGKERLRAGDVSIAVNVRELGVGGDLVSIGADRALRPASNMKLVTSAAALTLLGPDWCFQTVLDTAAPRDQGRVQGDVVVHAAGDPLLDWDAEGEVDGFVAKIAGDLKRHGVAAIDGALVLDEGDFQTPAPGPAWPSERERWEEFCALSGGFSANAGCLTIVVRATQPGASAEVEVHPRHHGFAPKIAVQTLGAKGKLDVRVEVRNGTLRIEGTIPKDVPRWTSRFAVPDPVELFGNAVTGGLRASGVAVRDGWRRERAPAGVARVEIARLKTPLVDTLVPINTHSNNACADQVFLATGHALNGNGTREGGRAATAQALAKLGVPLDGFVQVDGSGLSRDNKVSARQIAALIDAVLRLDARTSKAFLDSLAVGAETGTLDGRMKKADLAGRVHAKTGFINGTGALSGVVDTHDGKKLVFSILVEYPSIEGLNKNCWKPMEDAICEELAGWNG